MDLMANFCRKLEPGWSLSRSPKHTDPNYPPPITRPNLYTESIGSVQGWSVLSSDWKEMLSGLEAPGGSWMSGLISYSEESPGMSWRSFVRVIGRRPSSPSVGSKRDCLECWP